MAWQSTKKARLVPGFCFFCIFVYCNRIEQIDVLQDMNDKDAFRALLIMTTVPDEAVAKKLARVLVERRLAACVHLLPPIRAVYRWQNAIEEATEVPVHIKSVQARYAELEAAIRELHPYEVPEIVAVPIAAGSQDYLGWLGEQVGNANIQE